MNEREWEKFCEAHPDVEDAMIEGLIASVGDIAPVVATVSVTPRTRHCSGHPSRAVDETRPTRPAPLDIGLAVDTPTEAVFRLTIPKAVLGNLFTAVENHYDPIAANYLSSFLFYLVHRIEDTKPYGL